MAKVCALPSPPLRTAPWADLSSSASRTAAQSGFSSMAAKLREDWKLTFYPSDHWDQHIDAWIPYSNTDGSFVHKELTQRIPTLLDSKAKWQTTYGLIGFTVADP